MANSRFGEHYHSKTCITRLVRVSGASLPHSSCSPNAIFAAHLRHRPGEPGACKLRSVTDGHRRVFRVGLTGGIASGKSTVATLFAALGVPTIDADEVARAVVTPGTQVLARIIERFGPAVLDTEGALNRRALRQIVFADPAARADLEALTHPAVRAAMEERSSAAGGRYQIFVIPLLLETANRKGFDRVLVVDCDPELQIRRLQARDGSTLEQVRAILDAQVSRAVRLKEADDLITNDGELHALTSQVERLHLQYIRMAAAQATP